MFTSKAIAIAAAAVTPIAAAPTARAQAAKAAVSNDLAVLVGDWAGPMPIQPAQTLVIHVRKSATGGVEATLDSPEKRVNGVPMTGPHRDGAKVDFEIDSIRFRYAGVLSPDGRTIHGTMTQGAAPALPVTLTKGLR